MKIGDLVRTLSPFMLTKNPLGIIVGFNKKGEGGKDFVHILMEDGTVMMFNSFDVKVVNSLKK